jgi:hypothetical protein
MTAKAAAAARFRSRAALSSIRDAARALKGRSGMSLSIVIIV